MASLLQSRWATAEVDSPAPAPPRKNGKGKGKVTLMFGTGRNHTAETSSTDSAQRRPSTSQGPEAFNVFGASKAGPSILKPTHTDSEPVPAAAAAAPVAAQQSQPAAGGIVGSRWATAEAEPTPTHQPSFQPVPAPVDSAPLAAAASVPLPPPPPPAPSTNVFAAAAEPGSRKGSLSPELAQMVARIEQLKRERDEAVEQALRWNAHTRSLLEKMAVFAPLLALLEECRTLDATLNA